jgi:riboflavin synthase
MFTGLIQTVGQITRLERNGNDVRLTCHGLNLSSIMRGDSIAVSGACLTVAAVQDDVFDVDVSTETLARTTLGRLEHGQEVNLEPALTPTSKLGGHLVTGHIDGVGEIISREQVGGSVRLMVAAPADLARYVAGKGSICMDGVSLTVNEVKGATFSVNIIPHTLQVTTLKYCVRDSLVNLEVDLVARYLERLLLGDRAALAGSDAAIFDVLARHNS